MKAHWIGRTIVTVLIATAAVPAYAQMAPIAPDTWNWRAAPYLWMPEVKTSTQLALPRGGTISSSTNTSFRDILADLKFALAGTIEGRRGPWSFVGDLQYINLGSLDSHVTTISGPAGNISVPIDVGSRVNLKNVIGTFDGGYALLQTSDMRVDLTGGLRYTYVKAELDWKLSGPNGGLSAQGSVSRSKDFVDGVAGVRGSASLGNNWDLRYYADVGAGSSRLTWQAAAFIGYNLSWGDAVIGYRYLSYDFDNGPISALRLRGPEIMVGVKF